ncbi:MAG: ParB/RepB/Spo0J family partition protein [Lachnospiraceae bacterium]|nr:ParB/RepB/Spo0J family partition protein [Lachnospiraceae bacterium]
MKANAPKRKIFNDAVDLLGGADAPVGIPENAVQMLPVNGIRPFPEHPFRLYEGERLEEMLESIREHGVLVPVIVWKQDDGYVMLAGHNRMRAAGMAGLTEIPAIVKENLSEQDAYVYVIETNMIQRSFSELSISEKAAVLEERYDKVLYQRNREAIVQELTALEGKDGHGVQHLTNRDSLGEEHGLSGRTAARLMRVNHLIPELKERVDSGELAFVAGVGLSYLSEEEQRMTLEAAEVMPGAEQVKELREQAGSLTAETVASLLAGSDRPEKKKRDISLKIPDAWREKYFSGMEKKQIAAAIEEALEAWAAGKGAVDVQDRGA